MASRQIDDPDDDHRLIETMRYDGIRLPMLDRHVDRLSRSASYFGFPFEEGRFRRRVNRAVRGTDPDTILKVRTTLDRWGRLSVATTPLEEGNEPWRLVVGEERVDQNDPFFFHKTSYRAVYQRAIEAARGDGFDEAILLNGEGEVTEGTRSNLFIRDGDELLTPPVRCGLLAGVYREYVLEREPKARERVLTLDDLKQADELYCCNAVRGWNRAVMEVKSVASP